jgi:hypothetical protein
MGVWDWIILGGVLLALALLAWKLDVYQSLSRSGHGSDGTDPETAAATRDAVRDIERGRSAGQGMWPV